jgi:hypothetical protein
MIAGLLWSSKFENDHLKILKIIVVQYQLQPPRRLCFKTITIIRASCSFWNGMDHWHTHTNTFVGWRVTIVSKSSPNKMALILLYIICIYMLSFLLEYLSDKQWSISIQQEPATQLTRIPFQTGNIRISHGSHCVFLLFVLLVFFVFLILFPEPATPYSSLQSDVASWESSK